MAKIHGSKNQGLSILGLDKKKPEITNPNHKNYGLLINSNLCYKKCHFSQKQMYVRRF
jgi:hypothetical protein